MRKIALLALCLSPALLAEEAADQYARTAKTEHMDFPAGGLLRVNHSIGDLTIEGWDQPGIEITTTKTTKEEVEPQDRQKGVQELDQVRLAPEQKGNVLTLTEMYPRYGRFLFFPGNTRFYLETHISVPRNARLEIRGSGDLYIHGITGAIDADLSHGTMVLRMPENGHYAIDAGSKFGTVNSDFPGKENRRAWLVGHEFNGAANSAAQKLHLRAGYGDVIILKIRQPEYPAPVKPAS
jgi:hypothetical protein